MDNSRTTNVNVAEETPKKRIRLGCGCWIAILVFLALNGAIGGYLAGTFALRQEVPTPIEATMADLAVRTIMIQPEFSDWRMPDKHKTAESIANGKNLFGAECALCHGNTGKGDGSFGVTMFPPAADLTAERTRSKTDGQIYWLIWHGVNYTGMPAWGDDPKIGGANSQDEIWNMVAYIRSLQGILPAE